MNEKESAVYQNMAMEQYKLYIEMTNHVSERRDDFQKFFITLNTCFLAFIFVYRSSIRSIALVSCIGVLICLAWYGILRSHRKLNVAKLKMIKEMEKQLPFQPYTKESEFLISKKSERKFFEISQLERYISVVLIAIYAIIISRLFWIIL